MSKRKNLIVAYSKYHYRGIDVYCLADVSK
jgi:hypothetical protein